MSVRHVEAGNQQPDLHRLEQFVLGRAYLLCDREHLQMLVLSKAKEVRFVTDWDHYGMTWSNRSDIEKGHCNVAAHEHRAMR